MAAFEVIALDTATPQLRAPGASDTYTFPRAVEMPLGTANGVLYLNGSNVATSGSALTFDGTALKNAGAVVSGASGSAGVFTLNRSSDGNGIAVFESLAGTNNVGLRNAQGDILFSAAGSEQMRLTSTGLGIGTSSPGYKLDVSGGHARIRGAQALFWGNSDNTNLISIYNGGLSGASTAQMVFETNATEKMRLDSSGNLGLGGSASRATTVGTAALNIFDGTAPAGTLANGISIYSSAGEAYVMDAAGNATLFSPHDAETNEWIFRSKHTPTGKVLKIDVERLLKFVNDHFGLNAVHEFIET